MKENDQITALSGTTETATATALVSAAVPLWVPGGAVAVGAAMAAGVWLKTLWDNL